MRLAKGTQLKFLDQNDFTILQTLQKTGVRAKATI